jgi:hypothetical protein
MQKNGNYVWVKYAENTACKYFFLILIYSDHNAIAAVAQGKHINLNTNGQSQTQPTPVADWNKF